VLEMTLKMMLKTMLNPHPSRQPPPIPSTPTHHLTPPPIPSISTPSR